MAQVKPEMETFARIRVIGVGGGGGNAVSRMVTSNIQGVDFVGVNADAQDLARCLAKQKLLIGKNLTKGLGAGMNPDIGRQAAEENRDEIQEIVKGSDMVFVTCGLGGGVGSGAAPVVAEAAREAGALTVGVVTKPFAFEGKQRREIAERAWRELKERVDTLITIPNDKLLHLIDRNTPLLDAFGVVDDVLRQGVQGISDLIVIPGVVNVDFADVRAIMKDAGSALMGIGRASGEDRAVEAAKMAINSPLLEISIDGARGVLFNVSGGPDLSMAEINDAAKIITESIDPEAKVIFGATLNEKFKKGEIKITVVATGFHGENGPRQQTIGSSVSSSLPSSHIPEDKFSQQQTIINSPINSPVQQPPAYSTPSFSRPQQIQPQSQPQQQSQQQTQHQHSHAPVLENHHEEIKKRDFESELKQLEKEEEDDWDIPTFIRKKMK